MSMHTRFSGLMATQEKPLPQYVQRELEAFLKCGRMEPGFLRVNTILLHSV